MFSPIGFSEPVIMPNLDSDFTCTNATIANRYVADFHINVASFGGMNLCENNSDTKKLFNDLQIIEFGRFKAPEQNNLIQGFVSMDQYYLYLKNEIQGIRRSSEMPFSGAYNSGGYLSIQDSWSHLPTLGRVGIEIHEARHSEGYDHVKCSNGPYSASEVLGCDSDFNEGGSHAVEVEYYARVAEFGTNFHPVYQAMARMMALSRANFVFNKNPLKKSTALVIINSKSQTLVYNGKSIVHRPTIIPAQFKLKATSYGATLFDGVKAWAIDVYQRHFDLRQIEDDFSYFKLLKQENIKPITGGGQAAFVDLEELDVGQRRYFVYINNQGIIGGYNFPKGNFDRPMALPLSVPADQAHFQTLLPDGQAGLFLISGSDIWSLDPLNLAGSKLSKTWDQNYLKHVPWLDQIFSVRKSGQVINAKTQRAVDDLQTLSVQQMVAVPVYDAFEIQP